MLRKKIFKAIGIFFLLLFVWIMIDVYKPVQNDMRIFNPKELALMDQKMWRSYYDKKVLLLYLQLAKTLRTQYKIPFFRSYLIAFYAAKAAFVFKKGKNRNDYKKALPELLIFFKAIRQCSIQSFEPQQVAVLELEWWIVHRQRDKYTLQDLENVLAETAAAIYQIPAEKLTTYARLRAEAMHIRDNQAEKGKLSEADWQKIYKLLIGSWISFQQAVQ